MRRTETCRVCGSIQLYTYIKNGKTYKRRYCRKHYHRAVYDIQKRKRLEHKLAKSLEMVRNVNFNGKDLIVGL